VEDSPRCENVLRLRASQSLTNKIVNAVVGTAISKPTNPRKYMKISNERIMRSGCKPTLLPMILGERKVTSVI
jgi:hypothetical protein